VCYIIHAGSDRPSRRRRHGGFASQFSARLDAGTCSVVPDAAGPAVADGAAALLGTFPDSSRAFVRRGGCASPACPVHEKSIWSVVSEVTGPAVADDATALQHKTRRGIERGPKYDDVIINIHGSGHATTRTNEIANTRRRRHRSCLP